MYKLLLCVRYLRTRYIALASIISVMLGVATMIVVNAVMEGFSHEMQDRIHGILADIVVEAHSLSGLPDPEWHMDRIREAAGDDIEGMTAVVHVPAMLSYKVRGEWITRQINFIGIDADQHIAVSDFAKYLQHPENRERLSFLLKESGYDVRDQTVEDGKKRRGMESAGWPRRRSRAEWDKRLRQNQPQTVPPPGDKSLPGNPFEAVNAQLRGEPAADANPDAPPAPGNIFAEQGGGRHEAAEFDPAQEQHVGVILGMSLASIRDKSGEDHFMLLPGDDVQITFPTAGTPPKAVSDTFTVVDFYQSKMNEYDSSFVFVPLKTLQTLRGMIEPSTGVSNVTSIQIKLKEGRDLKTVQEKISQTFPPSQFPISVSTWRQKQGPFLAAVEMETVILNILLFLIIAVAGFGILATFFMIVVEKTRDIGILKSLGASSRGIMGIFLSYGLALGSVGSVVGALLGLLFVSYINDIATLLGTMTGRELFDPSIYFFQKIPTIVQPFTVSWIVGGAIVIAIMASVLPACRAALLRPVEALRYE